MVKADPYKTVYLLPPKPQFKKPDVQITFQRTFRIT